MDPPTDSSDYFLDAKTVRRSFDRASATFDHFAAVHTEIGNRLSERLDVVRLDPVVVLDLGAGTGRATRALKRRYRSAQVIAVDLSPRMLEIAGRRSGLFTRFSRVAGDAQWLPIADASIDLIFSNLMLQWIGNPDAAIAEARRVLKPEGLFTFASLGPDSLRELREAWALADAGQHVHAFIDMHDIGDALLRAGFAEPVMDTERLTITYRDFPTLLAELRGSGSVNAAHGRSRGLTGRRIADRARHAIDALQRGSVLPISLEIVYGHAWAGALRKRGAADQEVRVPITKIGMRSR